MPINFCNNISSHLNKELFLVVMGDDDENCEIHIADTYTSLTNFLKTMRPDIDFETRVFHGMITSADALPTSFYGKSVYLIYQRPQLLDEVCIIESGCETVDSLASDIKSIIDVEGIYSDIKDASINEILINEIFVLYGYQINVCLSIDDDGLDEETIYTCGKIVKEVEESKRLLKSSGDYMSKKVIELQVYGGKDSIEYTGRCLGLIDENEYATVMSNSTIRNRMYTVASKPLKEIQESDVSNKRLVIVVKTRNKDVVSKKVLFISEPLDIISSVTSNNDVCFVGKNGSYIMAEEK